MQHPVLAHHDPQLDVLEVEGLLEECVKVRVCVPVPLLGKPSLLINLSHLPDSVHCELPDVDQKHRCPCPQTDPLAHCMAAPQSELLHLTMAVSGLQASEGVHLGCEDHHEQVWSEEVGLMCAQNGAKWECLVVPLYLARTPPE